MGDLTNKEKEDFVLGIHDDDSTALFKEWNEDKALTMAQAMGLELTEAHWGVIKFIRLHYANSGPARHAREYTEVLNERFADEGGSRFLYQLFPAGPVKQGCAIAGVPAPADAGDNAFGSSL